MMRLRVLASVGILTVALLGCTSGDDSSSGTVADDSGGSTTTEPSATGPSPGVTDDTIKIGVTYVDTEPLKAVGLDYDLGDHGPCTRRSPTTSTTKAASTAASSSWSSTASTRRARRPARSSASS